MVHLGLRKNSPPQKDLNTRRRGGYPEQKLTSTSTQNPGALHQAKPAWASPSPAASVAVSSVFPSALPILDRDSERGLVHSWGGMGLRFLLTPRTGFYCISPGLRPPFSPLRQLPSVALPLHTQKASPPHIFLQLEKRTCVSSASTFFFCLAPFTGGGGVFILWKLEEAKQFRLLRWVGVCLCVCSFLSMWRSPLSYLFHGSCLLPSAEC